MLDTNTDSSEGRYAPFASKKAIFLLWGKGGNFLLKHQYSFSLKINNLKTVKMFPYK